MQIKGARYVRKHPADTLRVIGLKKFLEGSKELHDGKDYSDFVRLLENEAPLRRIAEIFKVSRTTIYKYLTQFEIEQLKK